MKVSRHVEVRLERFQELLKDPSYGKARAIKGLKSWKSSQAYRLTEFDKRVIDRAIANA